MSDDNFKEPGPEKEAPKPARGRAWEAKANRGDPRQSLRCRRLRLIFQSRRR